MVVLRLSQVPLDDAREAFIREVFGDGIVIYTDDLPFGENPRATVSQFVRDIETNKRQPVVAVELDASPNTCQMVLAGINMPSVTFFRVVYERDQGGQLVVESLSETGKPTYKFSHYEQLVRLETVVAPMRQPG